MKKSSLSQSDFNSLLADLDLVLNLSRSLRIFLSSARNQSDAQLLGSLREISIDNRHSARRKLIGLLQPIQDVAFSAADFHKFITPIRDIGSMSSVTQEVLLDSLRSFLTGSGALLRVLHGLEPQASLSGSQERLIGALDVASRRVEDFLGLCSASLSSEGAQEMCNVRSQRDDGTSVVGCSSGDSAKGGDLTIQLSLSGIGDVNRVVIERSTSSSRESRVSEAVTSVLHVAGGNMENITPLSGDGRASADKKVSPKSRERSRDGRDHLSGGSRSSRDGRDHLSGGSRSSRDGRDHLSGGSRSPRDGRDHLSGGSSRSSRDGRGHLSGGSSRSSRDGRGHLSGGSSGSSRDGRGNLSGGSSGSSRDGRGNLSGGSSGSSRDGRGHLSGGSSGSTGSYFFLQGSDYRGFRSSIDPFRHAVPFQPRSHSLPNVFILPSTGMASMASSATNSGDLQSGGGSASSVPVTPPSKLESVQASHKDKGIPR